MGRVSGKIILVTGGASGMGRTHCELLAEEGGTIIVTDMNVAKILGALPCVSG